MHHNRVFFRRVEAGGFDYVGVEGVAVGRHGYKLTLGQVGHACRIGSVVLKHTHLAAVALIESVHRHSGSVAVVNHHVVHVG